MDSIFALGQNGFTALCSIDPVLEDLGKDVFSNAAKGVDRTVVPPEQLEGLKGVLEAFVRRLSGYILDGPTGKVLEWLVRRFRCADTRALKGTLKTDDTPQD